MKTIKLLAFAFLMNVLAPSVSFAQSVETQIKITGIRSTKGKILISAFKDAKSYDKEQAYKTFSFDKKAFVNGMLTVEIKLDPGTYGITLLDDENANGKMEKSMIGMPKEGFGFSNFFMEKMKKPAYDDFKVVVKSNGTPVIIKVKYM